MKKLAASLAGIVVSIGVVGCAGDNGSGITAGAAGVGAYGGSGRGGTAGSGGGGAGGNGAAGRGGSGGVGVGGTGVGGGATGSLCPGAAPWPSGTVTCHKSSDCAFSGTCSLTTSGTVGCGFCQVPQNTCAIDADCGVGMVCQSYRFDTPCNCTSQKLEMRCVPACTTASCAPDESCLATGHCGPTSCNQGFVCSSDQVCRPAANGADPHGCAPASCSSDGYACTADEACDPTSTRANTHDCAPTQCSLGYTCPQGYTCTPSNYSDPHGCTVVHCTSNAECMLNFRCIPSEPGLGCVRLSCQSDRDCDCGACVEGKCYDRIGACTSPAA